MKIDVRGIDYHVEMEGAGEAILLLHGFTGDCSAWDLLVERLKQHYQLITIDIIGHGKTTISHDVNRYTMESVAKDLTMILDKLKIERMHVLGYSMGGRLALYFACMYPNYVLSLMLESTSPGLKTNKERLQRQLNDQKLAQRIIEKGVQSFIAYWENIPLFATQKKLANNIQKDIRNQRLKNHPIGLANSLLGMGTGKQPSLWNHLQYLQCDCLLIVGENDEKFCILAEEMEKEIKNVTKVVVKQAGHAVHVEKCEKFGTIIEEFLFAT